MLNRLVEFFISFLDLFRFWVVIDCYEQGVLLLRGIATRVLEPGIHLILPFRLHVVLTENVVLTTSDLPPQALVTKDGKSIAVSAIVTWKIKDIMKFMVKVEDARGVLADASRGTIRTVLCNETWQSLHQGGSAIDEVLTKNTRAIAHKWGIDVQSVCLSDVAPARVVRHLGITLAGSGEVAE